MKLLTSGGLLYSAVSAQTVDGHKGSFAELDWVAMFPEYQNYQEVSGGINVGWDPMVTAVIACYDGGKAMAGFGKYSGTIYNAWAMKLWGTTGSNNCGSATVVISGYVTMSVGIDADQTTAAECLTETQWGYSAASTVAPGVDAADAVSRIYLGATEEWNLGGAGAVGADADYYLVGGANAYVTYGLGNWNTLVTIIDYNGALQTSSQVTTAENLHFMNQSVMVLAAQVAAAPYGTAAATVLLATNGCFTTAHAIDSAAAAYTIYVGGFTASSHTCLEYASDGYVITGALLLYQLTGNATYATRVAISLTVPAKAGTNDAQALLATLVAIAPFDAAIGGQAGLGMNSGTAVQVQSDVDDTIVKYDALFLIMTNQYFTDSLFIGFVGDKMETATILVLTKANYGGVRAFYGYCKACTDTDLKTSPWDEVVYVGRLGKLGTIGTGTITPGVAAAAPIVAITTGIFSDATNAVTGVVQIKPPTGGVLQFKGLSQGTTQEKYVEMICVGIQPYYYTTYPQAISAGASNGFMVNCYTGISQCFVNVSDGVTKLTNTSATSGETVTCMNDPRYMNWRHMAIKYMYIGTQSWFRTDSYWNPASSYLSSTWGPGIIMSANYASGADNNGTTNKGKTYVFAYGDGSGIQMNHMTFSTVAPTANTTAGSGTNSLTTAPTMFYNTSPNMVNENMCLSSNLLLEGTTDTSALSATITDYSDGYKAKTTLALEMILTGAMSGWRGVCMVYYSSQYVQDNTNGSMCHGAVLSSASGAGPTDFGSSYLMHVPAATWAPPAMSASVTPSSLAITDGKYAIVYDPAAVTSYLYTQGYYASAQWYQPKYASSYTLVGRYGKDDYVGAYCFQGSGSTSYFSAPGSAVQLTGAVSLATSILALGTAISLAL